MDISQQLSKRLSSFVHMWCCWEKYVLFDWSNNTNHYITIEYTIIYVRLLGNFLLGAGFLMFLANFWLTFVLGLMCLRRPARPLPRFFLWSSSWMRCPKTCLYKMWRASSRSPPRVALYQSNTHSQFLADLNFFFVEEDYAFLVKASPACSLP